MQSEEISCFKKNATAVAKHHNADVYIYSGDIEEYNVEEFRKIVVENLSKKRKNAYLIIATYGGDPDAGFRLMRTLQRHYDKVIVSVFGVCKSAGTLIALGAHKIIMGEYGEFGPLDIQTTKADELMSRSSGLDIFKAISVIQDQSYQSFESHFFEVVKSSRGAISAKTAADIACKLSIGIFSPIMNKIEPLSIGEMQRKTTIAIHYGNLLGKENLKSDTVSKLVYGYPSHGFVIDYLEAKELFKDVELANDLDKKLEVSLLDLNEVLLKDPRGQPVIAHITDAEEEQDHATDCGTESNPGDGEARVSTSKADGSSATESSRPKRRERKSDKKNPRSSEEKTSE